MRTALAAVAIVLGALCVLSCGSLKPVTALAASPQEGRHIEREFRISSGKRLEIDLKTGGSLNIAGWDNEQVRVDAYLGGRDGEDARVDFKENADGVEIYSHFDEMRNNHSSDLKFEIKVPRKFDLDIDTMGGAVKIDAVEGQINGKTMGGALNLSNLRGSLHLSTMGGGITLVNSDVDGSVSTMGGKVLIQDVVGNIKGSSMGGQVSYKNVTKRDGSSTGDEVRITTMGGEINVDAAPAGANVMTMGGDITIASAQKFVKAKTMGGNIKIGAVDGAVTATTMGGNVNVKVTGEGNGGNADVLLTSNGGDIELIVPAGLSMDFDIELAYTRKHQGDYKIVSDFGIQQRESDDWDTTHGSARKVIYGTGSVAGGRNKIRIRTINGNVFVRRG
ncbi:MAG: hypothetical protein WBP93_22960 [Pyrinomonadaceae bacterium]